MTPDLLSLQHGLELPRYDPDEPLLHAVQAAMERVCPHARGVVVVPENHTRNTYYFESLAALIDDSAHGRTVPPLTRRKADFG